MRRSIRGSRPDCDSAGSSCVFASFATWLILTFGNSQERQFRLYFVACTTPALADFARAGQCHPKYVSATQSRSDDEAFGRAGFEHCEAGADFGISSSTLA